MRELEITVEILFPLFLLLALGWVLRRIGWMSAQLTRETNKLIFQLFLPVLVFNNIRDMASGVSMDAGYAAYLFFGLLGIYLLAAVFVPRFEKHPQKRGVMVQGIFRTNFAALGAPLMEAMFGESGLAMYSLALPIVIPLNNILAVIALSSPGQKRLRPLEMLKSIVTNPLIIGCILGGIMLLTHLQLPTVVDSALRQVGGLASPCRCWYWARRCNGRACGTIARNWYGPYCSSRSSFPWSCLVWRYCWASGMKRWASC